MVAVGGFEAIVREGVWDETAFREAADTPEVVIGWMLAAAGGALGRDRNALAKTLVKEGYTIWNSLQLSEEELVQRYNFPRGLAKAFDKAAQESRHHHDGGRSH